MHAGLSEAESAARLAAEGANELSEERSRGLLLTLIAVLKEPMFLLLLGTGGIYLLLGSLEEAIALLSFVLVVIAITLVQERKTERAVAALRDLSSPRALVLRGGIRRRIPGREVVRGDVLVLTEGDRIAADATLLDATYLEVNESLLTGESTPVRKRASPEALARAQADTPLATAFTGRDDAPFVYAGTLVVRGHGLAEVRATGPRTAIGQIGTSLSALEVGHTPLQGEIHRIVKIIASAGLLLCAALFVLYGATRGGWMQGLLASLALAMAVLPEEFPVVLTIFMAMGAWRISKSRVLTRRLPAVEALGAATVLCSDKTGTLTENQMRVVRLWAPASPGMTHGQPHRVEGGTIPEAVHPVLEFGILASQRDPFDPMEQAFHRLGQEALAGTEHLHTTWELLREYPLSSKLLAVSHVWRSPDGAQRVVAAKGALEAIVDVCHLAPASISEVRAQAAAMGTDGLRVLAVARAWFEPGPLPSGLHDFDFELMGLAGLEDPLRAGVPEAVAECASAGIRVVMITGDSPDTARAIAARAGLSTRDAVVTGAELDALSDEALRRCIQRISIFARVVPEQKLRLVRALRAVGEVVAMTGDGVNDAPALKAAHIGIAMGQRGTDVAREAAALVLTDDDFTSIVGAVRLGRRIFSNLRRAMAYILAVHIPTAGLALVPVLLGWPLVLFPVHIVFLQLIIDPACSLAFESEPAAPDLMRQPPRRAGVSLFTRRLMAMALLQGGSLLIATLICFRLGLVHTGSEDSGRTLAFTTLIAGNVSLILINRSWKRNLLATLATRNAASWVIVGGATLTLLLAFWVPLLRHLFRFGPASADDLAIAAAAGFLSLAWFEALKRFGARWIDPPELPTA